MQTKDIRETVTDSDAHAAHVPEKRGLGRTAL